MKNILTAGFMSILLMTACTKDNSVAEKSLEQQKMEFQARQLEIEKQKLAYWRFLADSNRCRWCCRPLPNHSAKEPFGFANIENFLKCKETKFKKKHLHPLYLKFQLCFRIDYGGNARWI